MKAIVFGANGYMGCNFSHLLLAEGVAVTASDQQDSSKCTVLDYFQADITKRSDLSHIHWDVDYVFLLSGLNGVVEGFARYEDYVHVNEIGILNILDAIRQSPYRPIVIYPSTRLVYPGGTDVPFPEDAPLLPRSVYAISKLAGEFYLAAFHKLYDIPYLILRIGVPYGNICDRLYSYGTIFNFKERARNGKDIEVFLGGRMGRTLTHISDVFGQAMALLRDPSSLNQVWNIGGEAMTLGEVAESIGEKYGVAVKYTDGTREHRILETGTALLDDSKIQTKIAYSLTRDFRSWLKSLS